MKERVSFNKTSIKALKEKAANGKKKKQVQCWSSGDWADKPTEVANVHLVKGLSVKDRWEKQSDL